MQPISLTEFSQIIAPEDMTLGSVFGALTIEATQFLLGKGKLYTVGRGRDGF